MISSMVNELRRAVNHFTGKFKRPIRLETSATGGAADVDSLDVVGFMRIYG